MKRPFMLLYLPVVVSLGAFSYMALQNHPLSILLLKGDGFIEASRVRVDLGGGRSEVETLKLTAEQREGAADALKSKNMAALRALGRELGKFDLVGGETGEGSEGPWPWYLGSGWRFFFTAAPPGYFDNSHWSDRAYLALASRQPLQPPLSPADIRLDQLLPSPQGTPGPSVAAGTMEPTPTAKVSAVRMEILNGCGITNAADWAARRLRSQGISIVSTGNADRYDYPKTVVKSSIGVPVVLEDALSRLGLTKDAVEEGTSPSATVDVTLILGRDFNKLRERVHERHHH